MTNGYANRFLFACVRRAQLLPHGGDLDDSAVRELAIRVRERITQARKVSRVVMAAGARELWEHVSTPEQKCIGLPEQKYISDAGKKAPETGAFCSGIRLGSDYPPAAYPSWHGVSGACSD